MADLPLPRVDNPLTAPFWQGTRKHRLLMQRCPCCNTLQWPPKPNCTGCLADFTEADWSEVGQTGTVWSFVVYHRAFHPGFADKVPYNVAMVRLDDGPVMITSIVGMNEITVGQRVKACFDAVAPQTSLVRFRPAD